MAKKKLSISQLKKASEEAVEVINGKQENRNVEKQKRKDNAEYRTVRINSNLHYKLKMEAVKNQMKITDYIEQLLEKSID